MLEEGLVFVFMFLLFVDLDFEDFVLGRLRCSWLGDKDVIELGVVVGDCFELFDSREARMIGVFSMFRRNNVGCGKCSGRCGIAGFGVFSRRFFGVFVSCALRL